MATAAQWVSRITTISIEMVLPGLAGVWLDGKLGTVVLFTLAGFAFGISFGIWHLVRMTASDDEPPRTSDEEPPQP